MRRLDGFVRLVEVFVVPVVDVAGDTLFLEFGGTRRVIHLQTLLASPRRYDEIGRRAGEHDGCGEDVDADAGDEGGRIRAQQFHSEAAHAVTGHIEGEQTTMPDAEPAVDVHQRHHDGDIPQQFVEERRVHHGHHVTVGDTADQTGVAMACGVGALIDLQTPRHRGLPAVELLVEVVAEPADGLRQQDGGCDGIAEGGQPDAVPPRADPRAEGAEEHRPPDAETTVPDLQRVDRVLGTVAEIRTPVGDQVVDAATDQAEGHRPDGDVEDLAILAAPGDPAPVSPPDGDDDADDDAQRVGAEREGPDVPHALRRTRDVGQQRRGRCDHAATLTDPLRPSRDGHALPRRVRRPVHRGGPARPWRR